MKHTFRSITFYCITGIFTISLCFNVSSCKKDNSGPNAQFVGVYSGTDTTILGTGDDVMTVTGGANSNSILVADESQGVTFGGTVSGNNITFPYQSINYGYGTLTAVGTGKLTGKILNISLTDTSAGIAGTYGFTGSRQ